MIRGRGPEHRLRRIRGQDLPGGRRVSHCRQTDECGAADADRADHGEDLTPRLGRHANLRKPQSCMITSHCGWRCEDYSDHATRDRRLDHRERELADD